MSEVKRFKIDYEKFGGDDCVPWRLSRRHTYKSVFLRREEVSWHIVGYYRTRAQAREAYEVLKDLPEYLD